LSLSDQYLMGGMINNDITPSVSVDILRQKCIA